VTVTTFSFTYSGGIEPLRTHARLMAVADIAAIRTAAEGTKDDDALVLAVAKVLGADPAEVRKKRDADPQWFADVVAKYGLDQGEGGEAAPGEGLMARLDRANKAGMTAYLNTLNP